MLEPINVSLASLNMITLAPMLIAIVGGLIILIIDLIKGELHKSLYVMLTILILFIDFGSVLGLNLNERGFFDIMLVDGIAIISQLLILAASMLFIPLSLTSKRFHEYSYSEFFALFLFMIAGFQFMVVTDNLILIFIGIETASLSLYTLIALHNRDNSYKNLSELYGFSYIFIYIYTWNAASIVRNWKLYIKEIFK
jgi:NADH-quinone oxidoreductase subunit N